MANLNVKELTAELKKGSLSRIYYIFGADTAGVSDITRKIIKAAVGDNEEFALTKLDGKRLDMSQCNKYVEQFEPYSSMHFDKTHF